MANELDKTTLSTDELKVLVEEADYYTFFKDRLYIYNQADSNIVGYMLKDDFDVKKMFKKKDEEAAEAFASIELQFKDPADEEKFDYDTFVETVISELEVWLSYDSALGEVE